MSTDTSKDTSNQHKKKYEWLKPYQWKKGQTGNPTGKNGKSLKQWVKEYLMNLSEKDRTEYMKHVDPELAWRMAEGNPKNDDSLKIDLPNNLVKLFNATNQPTDSGIKTEDKE